MLLEPNDYFIVLFETLAELVSQVYQVVRVDISTFEVLTVAIDVVAVEVLVIEENYHFVVCVADYCASDTEGNELSLGRVDVHHTVTYSIVIAMLERERLAPIGEVLLVKHAWLEEFILLAIQLNALVILCYQTLLFLKLFY